MRDQHLLRRKVLGPHDRSLERKLCVFVRACNALRADSKAILFGRDVTGGEGDTTHVAAVITALVRELAAARRAIRIGELHGVETREIVR